MMGEHPGEPLGLGIFGYGFIAGVHAAALRHVDGARVAAVCGPRIDAARELARKHAIADVYSDPDQLLARDDVIGVLVDTPDVTHYDLVTRALRAGKHVFCEKPLARTVEEAREMYAAATAGRRRTVVGFSNRWYPVVAAIKAMVDNDDLGEIVHVYGQALNASLVRSARPRFTWRTNAARTGTGILGDLGAHYVDLTHHLLGPITEVCAELRTVVREVFDDQGVTHPHLVDDDALLMMRLATPKGAPAHGTLAVSRLGSVHSDYPVGRRHYLIDGRKGGVLFENGRGWFFRPGQRGVPIAGDSPAAGTGQPGPAGQPSHEDALLQGAIAQMQTFVWAIREDRDIAPTFREGLQCQEVLHAAVESSKAHAWRPVAPVER
jgi:predicted dehydrogenase